MLLWENLFMASVGVDFPGEVHGEWAEDGTIHSGHNS